MQLLPFIQSVASKGGGRVRKGEARVVARVFGSGGSKTALAARQGISRGTIHNWIRAGQLDRELDGEPVRYQPRPAVSRKLDGFRGIVECRLEEFPQLSATRLFDELR